MTCEPPVGSFYVDKSPARVFIYSFPIVCNCICRKMMNQVWDGGTMAKNTVLIVEDDAPTCALWTRHLEHWGWNVHAVSSAEEAEIILDQQPPQAVVLDIMLSDEKSGWD